MRRVWAVAVACALGTWAGPGLVRAEVVDVVQNVQASGSIGAVASLTVLPRNISDNGLATGLNFGNVAVSGGTPWVVAPQYLQVQHQSNHSNWAIRILTNNRAAHPMMEGKVLIANDPDDDQDDILGYGGLIGSNSSDPNNRVALAWQVYTDPQPGGPAAPLSTQVGGDFNSPWAFLADASDCPSTATNCRSASPDTIDKTLEFFRVAQGDASNAFLLLHPDNGNRIADGDIAVYVTGEFGAAPADAYSSTIILELYHL